MKPVKIFRISIATNCDANPLYGSHIEATKFLCISHNAFHALINGSNCSRLSYIPDKVRYYAPDIEYLKDTPKFKRATRRQIKYIKTKDYIKN